MTNSSADEISKLMQKHGFQPIAQGTHDFYAPLLEFIRYLDARIENRKGR